jgi:carboxymethylenebutenolidase
MALPFVLVRARDALGRVSTPYRGNATRPGPIEFDPSDMRAEPAQRDGRRESIPTATAPQRRNRPRHASKEPHMPDIEFSTSSGTAPGYLATPASGSGPATIVLQEWWGVDGHIRSICDRLAEEGFFALAPDLFRGETTTQPSEAEQKMMALSMEQAEQDMCGAADYLTSQPGVEGPGVGAVGFCLGGGLAVWAAAACPQITAAVTYYYVMPHGKPDFTQIKGPVLGHFGTADEFVSVDDAEALEAEIRDAGAEVTFEFYQGAGHAFFNDTNRLGTYDKAHAEASWQRTVSFLRSGLAS